VSKTYEINACVKLLALSYQLSLLATVILRNSVQLYEICADINTTVLSILILDAAESIMVHNVSSRSFELTCFLNCFFVFRKGVFNLVGFECSF